jgi:hypothetical protein
MIITVIPIGIHEGIALPPQVYEGMKEIKTINYSQGIGSVINFV